jgi:very-short-patch-repair endonuclease/predicted transcriptional regulator of viral defense system
VSDQTPFFHGIDEKGRASGVDATIAALASEQHGVVGRRQLLELGLGRGQIDGRLARGQLHRVYRGAYAVGHPVVSRDGRRMAAVLSVGRGAILSFRSAGELWRLTPRWGGSLELTAPKGWRSTAGLLVRRFALPDDEVTEVDGIPVSSVSRTLFDLAAELRLRQLERAWNEMEVRRLTSRVSVPDLLTRYPRRRGAANLRTLLVAKMPAGVTESDFEELFVAFLDSHGLPRPRLNATLPIRGRLLRPDCMWLDAGLLVELDGRAAHGTGRAFESDRQRDRMLLAEGWQSMRVTWRQLHDEPAAIAADLGGLLKLGS